MQKLSRQDERLIRIDTAQLLQEMGLYKADERSSKLRSSCCMLFAQLVVEGVALSLDGAPIPRGSPWPPRPPIPKPKSPFTPGPQ